MAKIVSLVDDVDETSDADQTVSFSVMGKAYEIDLCNANAAQFAAELDFWTKHARRAKTEPRMINRPRVERDEVEPGAGDDWWMTPPGATKAVEEKYKRMRLQIREWGLTHGYPSLGDRGRLPRSLYAKWQAAQSDVQQRHRAEDNETDPEQTELDVEPEFSHAELKKKRGTRAAS